MTDCAYTARSKRLRRRWIVWSVERWVSGWIHRLFPEVCLPRELLNRTVG